MTKLSHVNMDKITVVKRGQILEAEARAMRPRSMLRTKPRPKFWSWGQFWHQSL